jgi:integrase
MTALGPANVLSEQDVLRLIASMSSSSRTAARDRALVVLLWRTGLRVSEALNLRRSDLFLDQDPPRLRVSSSKTHAGERWVGLHRDVVEALSYWIDLAPDSEYVVCTHKGTRMHPSHARRLLARHGKRLEIRRVHPHAFRATLAVELVREGQPLPVVRDVLGHVSIANTDAYLRRVFPELAISAVIDR